MLYWGIDFLNGTRPFGFGDFENDQIIFYNGLYDVPSYIIWWARSWPDKPVELALGNIFMFFMYDQFGKVAYIDYFIIQDFYFDVTKSMWRIFAINGGHYLLSKSKAISYYESSADHKNPVSGIDIIKSVTQKLFNAKYPVIDDGELEDVVQYVQMSLDYDMSVLDLITRICKENRWEFYIGPDALYIGQTLYVLKYVKILDPAKEEAKIAYNYAYTTVSINAASAEPLLRWGDKGRVVWTKHYLSNEGSETTLFISNQQGTFEQTNFPKFIHLTNDDFYDTLHGIALEYARIRQNQMYRQNAILAGKIYGTFLPNHLSQYEAPQFTADIDNLTKSLNTRTFKKPIKGHRYLKNSKMTTPYAGNGVGMLFPQEESHRVLLTPDGEREVSLIGPAYFGPQDEVPAKIKAEDFRLQLPDNTVIYNENGTRFRIVHATEIDICIGNMGPTATSPSPSAPYIKLDADSATISAPNIPNIELKDDQITIQGPGGAPANAVTITDSKILIQNPTEVEINTSEANIIKPLVSVSRDEFKVEILGDLDVMGNIESVGQIKGATMATYVNPNIDAAIKAKVVPPG